VFRDTSLITTAVPSYLGGLFVFAWGCDDPTRRKLSITELAARPLPEGLRCYTPAVHGAAFVHPPWLTALSG
jgi:spermidine synthase